MLNTGASSSSDQSLSVNTSSSVNSSSMATFVLWCISEVLLCVLLKGLLLESEYLKFKELFAIASFLLFRVSSKFISLLSDSICFLLLLSGDLNLLLLLLLHHLLIFITNSYLHYFKYHNKSNIRDPGDPLFSPKNNFFWRIFRVPRVGALIIDVTEEVLDDLKVNVKELRY